MTRTQLSTWQPWQIFSIHHRAKLPPAALQPWILESSSLTARLRRQLNNVEVHLTDLYTTRLGPELATLLNLSPKSSALVREVILSSGGSLCFSAQTYIPRSSLVGETRRLRHWNTRSLGDFLFRDPDPCMSRLEFAVFREEDELVWGRRRCHYLYNRPIMVSEYFPRSSHCAVLT